MLSFLKTYKFALGSIQKLNEIERFQGLWEFSIPKLSPDFIKELKQSAIVTSSGASTRIEGSLLSDKEVEELLKKDCKINSMSSRSEREVSGYVKGLRFIYDHHNGMQISEVTIRELHQVLTSDLEEEHLPSSQRGTYKNVTNDVVEKNLETGEEKVWFKTTPPGPQTEAEMRQLVKDLNQFFNDPEINKLIVIAAFVVVFLAIHPFRDGNGRLSRLLTVFLLLKAGYEWAQFCSHEKVIEDNKNYYYVYLRNTQNSLKNQADFDEWFSFFFMVLEKQTIFLKGKLSAATPRAQMNANEARVLELLKEHGTATPAFLREHVKLSPDGMKTLLTRLITKGQVTGEGSNKGRKYSLKKS